MAAIAQEEPALILPLIEDEEEIKQRLGTQIQQDQIESNSSHLSSSSITNSLYKTCFNGLNALSGVGILSIPYALAAGGWLSLILLFAIATAAFYCGLLIQKCMDSDSNVRTYPDIGELAFGKKGRLIVSILMYTELYLVATGFLILEGDNLHNLFPDMEFQLAESLTMGGKQGFIIIVSLVILPTVWLDDLSLLSYVSASGVLASGIILGSTVWTGAFDGNIGFQQKGTLVNWDGMLTAISLYAFCYGAHPVFPTLYTSMKEKKKQFSNILVVCFTMSTVTYASMAIFGYLMFGSELQSQVTLNLPTNKISSKVAIYTALVNPIAKYALIVTPIINAIKCRFPFHYNRRLLGIFIGTNLLFSTVVVALAIPFFGSLMSLVGAFMIITVSVILPCLCYLKISGIYRRFNGELIGICIIIVLGVLLVIFGTYASVLDIIGNY